MWRQLPPAKKRLFQDSMFPEGVRFDGETHRTEVTASFLTQLRDLQAPDTEVASLTVASSDFFTRLGMLQEGLPVAA